MKIIGVGGRDRSGKDTISELLIEKGYYGVSFGDIIRDYARERHADKDDPISVKNMTETSNWLRSKKGPDVIMKEAVKRFKEAEKSKNYKGLVVFSIRAPIEVDFVLEHGGKLVWVESSNTVRFERRKSAHREGEAELTLKDMLIQESLQEQPQKGIPSEVQMNIKYVQKHATDVIENNGNDLDAFLDKAEKFVDNLL